MHCGILFSLYAAGTPVLHSLERFLAGSREHKTVSILRNAFQNMG